MDGHGPSTRASVPVPPPGCDTPPVPSPQLRPVVWFVGGLGVMVATTYGLSLIDPDDVVLAVIVLLLEVIVIGVVTGPLLGFLSGIGGVLALWWFSSTADAAARATVLDSIAIPVAFVLIPAGISLLVDVNNQARARSLRNARQGQLLSDVVSASKSAGPSSMELIRVALDLDYLSLIGPDDAGRVSVLVETGTPATADGEHRIDVHLPDGFRLVGDGDVPVPTENMLDLAAAARRAYESDRYLLERRRAEQLTATDQARVALLAGVGHDLRTPLAGLRLSIENLQLGDGLSLSDHDRSDLLTTAAESVDKLDELITNLLDLGRLEAGVLIARLEATSVDEAVTRAVVAIGDPDTVTLDIADGLPLVMADPGLLERVLANLVLNAVEHTPPSTAVEVLATLVGDTVTVDVVDHGPGMPAARRAALLQQPSVPVATSEGGGLGLAIVAAFSRVMNVDVTLSSTPGGGLTARLELPTASA